MTEESSQEQQQSDQQTAQAEEGTWIGGIIGFFEKIIAWFKSLFQKEEKTAAEPENTPTTARAVETGTSSETSEKTAEKPAPAHETGATTTETLSNAHEPDAMGTVRENSETATPKPDTPSLQGQNTKTESQTR